MQNWILPSRGYGMEAGPQGQRCVRGERQVGKLTGSKIGGYIQSGQSREAKQQDQITVAVAVIVRVVVIVVYGY